MHGPTSRTRSELGGYRIDALLARTGGSFLFLARDVGSGHEVLLDVARDELATADGLADQIGRDSVRAARLQHPHIAQIASTGVDDGVPYTASPDVNGVELTPLVEGLGGLSLARASEIISQVAGALATAHAAGLVHGTLEPSRILVAHRDGGDHALVTGFGYSPPRGSDGGARRPFGLPVAGCAAPEQIRGDEPTPATDVYALGCVLYHALLAEMPFVGSDEAAVLAAHLNQEPASVSKRAPEMPAAVDDVIARATAKDPADRYASPDDLAADLLAAAGPGRARHAESTQKQDTTARWQQSIADGLHKWSPSQPVTAWPQPDPAVAVPESISASEQTGTPDETGNAEHLKSGGSEPIWPQPPSDDEPAQPSPRRGRRIAPRVIAAVLAVAAIATLVVLLVSGGGSSSSSSSNKAPSSAGATKSPQSTSSLNTGRVPDGLTAWPRKDAFTAIIYVTRNDRVSAVERAQAAAQLGLRAGVLNSSDYRNLPSGRVVAFAGIYNTRAGAERAGRLLERKGIVSAPYVRRIMGSRR